MGPMGLMGLVAAARPITHSTRFMPAQGRAFNMTNHQSPFTSHLSLLTSHSLPHRLRLHLRFLALQLANPLDGHLHLGLSQ